MEDMLSGPNWLVSSMHGKAMDLLIPEQVRFCVVLGLQEILSPLVPFSSAKKSVKRRLAYTYFKLFSPWVYSETLGDFCIYLFEIEMREELQVRGYFGTLGRKVCLTSS